MGADPLGVRLTVAALGVAALAGLAGCGGSSSGQAPAARGPTGDGAVSSTRIDRPVARTRRVGCREAFAVSPSSGSRRGPENVGPVRFVAIADARPVTELFRFGDYLTAKTPIEVTMGRRTVVTISTENGWVLVGQSGRLPRRWADLPDRLVFTPCSSRGGGARHTAAFPAGVAVERPGCIRVTVRVNGRDPVRRSFPVGVPSC